MSQSVGGIPSPRIWLAAIWVVLGFMHVGVTHAAGGAYLEKGYVVLQAEDVVAMASNIEELLLIDARKEVDRRMGYIEGSIGLTDTYTNCDSLSEFIQDFDQPLVFYCNGERCARSARALNTASQCGYSGLYWFKGGINEWREKNFPVLTGR